ncbi:hypothetical protein FAVG1_13154 [Fusarium avenaceum]|nr:hypothetical protein FAVG1_13154 [Fusarium avenaceum]
MIDNAGTKSDEAARHVNGKKTSHGYHPVEPRSRPAPYLATTVWDFWEIAFPKHLIPGEDSLSNDLAAINDKERKDATGDSLDFYSPALSDYFQWEALELVDWSTSTELFQDQDNLANSFGQYISPSNELLASPDWEVVGHPEPHILTAGSHTSYQDINQADSNWLSLSLSHTLTIPQPSAKKDIRKRKTRSSGFPGSKRIQFNLEPDLDAEVERQGEESLADRGDIKGHRKENRAHKRMQAKNRTAATNSRYRKREEMEKMHSNKQDLEKINLNLTSCLKDLVIEAQQLKMNLLQHTNCECTLIQKYIQNEAQRFIKRREKISSFGDAKLSANYEPSLNPSPTLTSDTILKG